MARKQSRSHVRPIGIGAQSAHGNAHPSPGSSCPEHVLVRPPAAVDKLGRSALPGWVRQRVANPRKTAFNPNPEPADGSDEFLTVAELATIWRVSVRTLSRRLAAGEIPHIRVGRLVRIPHKVVLEGWE